MPLIALFIIAFVSLVIVRIGATALMMTGLSRPVAEFQAVSCFFGVGFTTAEAEMIVSHPVRRRMAMHLIIAGNIGITSALGALIISFVQSEPDWLDGLLSSDGPASFFARLGVILAGVTVIAMLFRPRVIKALLERIIRFSLERAGVARVLDYETVLHAKDGFVVAQFEVDAGHPLIGSTLRTASLGKRGVLVLGVQRDAGEHIGAPGPGTEIESGDVLTVYGNEAKIHAALDRPKIPIAPVDASGQGQLGE
ncbi:MAG: cation:proton antiporter regulatory subunit [Phycisphaerales bacterium]